MKSQLIVKLLCCMQCVQILPPKLDHLSYLRDVKLSRKRSEKIDSLISPQVNFAVSVLEALSGMDSISSLEIDDPDSVIALDR